MPDKVKKLTVRVTEREYEHLKVLSEQSGLKMEPTIRKLIMGVELRPRPPDAYADLLRELSAIGNNINQIAYWANAKRGNSDDRVLEAQELIQKAFRLLKERL